MQHSEASPPALAHGGGCLTSWALRVEEKKTSATSCACRTTFQCDLIRFSSFFLIGKSFASMGSFSEGAEGSMATNFSQL